MIALRIVSLGLLLSTGLSAQTAPTPTPPNQQATTPPLPSTLVEKFMLEKGRLISREYKRVGQFKGFYGAVSIEVATLSDPSSKEVMKGLRIEVEQKGTYANVVAAFLDVNEVDDFVKALDYISESAGKWNAEWEGVKNQKDADKLVPYREVSFATQGDFSVSYYREAKRDGALVRAGRIDRATANMEIADLATIKGFVVAAKAGLEK